MSPLQFTPKLYEKAIDTLPYLNFRINKFVFERVGNYFVNGSRETIYGTLLNRID